MFKHPVNYLINFAIICFCRIFETGNASQQAQPTVDQPQLITQNSPIPQLPNKQNNVVGIQPDSVVAISPATAGSEPQVFYTEKGAVPDNWKGWFYIMSGAEYINYTQNGSQDKINSQVDNIQQGIGKTPNNTNNQISNVQQGVEQPFKSGEQNQQKRFWFPPHYAAPDTSHQIIGRPGEQHIQYGPPQPPSSNTSSTNNFATPNVNQQHNVAQPTVAQQLGVVQQQVIPQQQVTTQQSVAIQHPGIEQSSAPERINSTTSDILVKEVTGGEKVEQGKPDNEVPEVLIHDGAVYTLANSVEVTNTTDNKNTTEQTGRSTLLQSQATQPMFTQQNNVQQFVQQQPETQSQIGQQQPNEAVKINNQQQFANPTVPNASPLDNISNRNVPDNNANPPPSNQPPNMQPGISDSNNR